MARGLNNSAIGAQDAVGRHEKQGCRGTHGHHDEEDREGGGRGGGLGIAGLLGEVERKGEQTADDLSAKEEGRYGGQASRLRAFFGSCCSSVPRQG